MATKSHKPSDTWQCIFATMELFTRFEMVLSQGYVYMPSFDHALGDPVEDDIFVSPL